MLMAQRQDQIVALLRDKGAAELDELASRLSVSASTVRRDLEALERKGLVERTHGGAVYRGPDNATATAFFNGGVKPTGSTQPSPGESTLARRMTEQVAQKQAIARHAASLVQPHMTVLMDGGSTVIYAAQQIIARPIQIVTNSLSIAAHFKDDDQAEVIMAGGSLYPRTEVTVGAIARGTIADLHADLLFFSLAGIHGDAAYNINMSMARVEQVMMQQAEKTVMLMDSGKFGRTSLVRVCGLGEVDQIITDSDIDPAWQEQLGQQLVIAES